MRDGAATGKADAAPLILTAAMAPADAAWATALRQAHFPPERNFLDAHITLFHHLPPSIEGELHRLLHAIVRETPPPPAQIVGVMSLGRGVALKLAAPGLLALRARIAERFAGCLTPQDQAPPRLHITVQNKVTPEAARALHARLTDEITPRPLALTGLAVHRYRGGPWEAVRTHRFASK